MINTKNSWLIILVLAMCFISFWIGRKIEHFASAYNYSVISEEEIPFEKGKLFNRYVTAQVGTAFLDPGTTRIEFQGTNSGIPTLLYSSDCEFQESRPFVRNIKTEGNQIYWEDGFYSFDLTIEELPEPLDSEPVR